MNVTDYLKRLGITGPIEPTTENLRLLHSSHLDKVPFENLDILLGKTIELSQPRLYEKIVTDHRGGFCYELNGLFYWLLSSLGYDVSMLAARVYNGTEFGLTFDHMLLLVRGFEEPLLVDVGFGDSFREPLILNSKMQHQASGSFQLTEDNDGFTINKSKGGAKAEPDITFDLTNYQLSDFEGMCTYQQTSEQSFFKQKSLCTIPTASGRMTISKDRLITSSLLTGQKQEKTIESEGELRQLLREHFGISLPEDVELNRLLEYAKKTMSI